VATSVETRIFRLAGLAPAVLLGVALLVIVVLLRY
jgi:hypothetical protein